MGSNLPGPFLWPTVTERFADDMLKRGERSRTTVRHYVNTAKMLQERYPTTRANQFTVEQLVDFLTSDEHDRRRDWAPNTLLRHRTAIVALFQWITEEGYRDDDVTLRLKRKINLRPKNVRNGTWLKLPQVQTLLARCEEDLSPVGRRDLILFTLALQTGLRVSEIANLRWENVDLEQGVITVVNGKGRYGGKTRFVAMSDELIHSLELWGKEFPDGTPKASWPVVPRTRRVFSTRQRGGRGRFVKGDSSDELEVMWDKGLHISGIQRTVKVRGEQIGKPSLAAHDLRRSFAGLLEDAGQPLGVIAEVLGHESESTTRRYLQANPSKLRSKMAAFSLKGGAA